MKLGADVTILNGSGQKVGDLISNNTDPLMTKALGKYQISSHSIFNQHADG